MIEMATTVEVDSSLEGDFGGNIVAGFSGSVLFDRSIVAVYVGLVVLAMVQLHNVAGNGGFQSAIVVWMARELVSHVHFQTADHIHVRSGRVAFVRTKVLLAVAKHRVGLVAATALREDGRATERNIDAIMTE